MNTNCLIIKCQKEIDFLNYRLSEAIFMGEHNKIDVKARLEVYEDILKDLNNKNYE